MAVSAVSISSNALILLGGQPIASFTDGDTGSLIAANLYETTYHSMLTETLWHFATRTERVAKTLDVPENGYTSVYQLPTECLYVVGTETQRYEIYGDKIYTNTESLLIEMVYAPDEVNLPPFFVKAMEYNLASRFAIPLTGNASRADFYRKLYELELKKAKRADASQRPPSSITNGRYTRIRNY